MCFAVDFHTLKYGNCASWCLAFICKQAIAAAAAHNKRR